MDIAKIIGRLGLLKLLQWDYISSEGVHWYTGDVVSTFGKYSPSLKYVLLHNFYKSKAFQIDRDSEGRYTGTSYIEDVRSIFGLEPGLEPLSLYTSAWRLDNYTYL